MKKVLAMVVGIVVVLGAFEASAGLNNYQQKVFYRCWSNNCLQLLLDAKWPEYMPCSKDCYAQAQAAVQGWCVDSDGVDFEKIGIVTTDTNPAGVTDYCLDLFGTTYVIEGACSASNLYYWYYKDCAEYSAKHYCLDGACEYVNNPPGLMVVQEKTEYAEGEFVEIHLSATDADGDELTFSAKNMPAGATLVDAPADPLNPDAAQAVFSWTPNFQQAGEYDIAFEVGDGEKVAIAVAAIIIFDMPASGLYCNDPQYDFCDDFEGEGMDIAKWKDLEIPAYLNFWEQDSIWFPGENKVLTGKMRAVTIPEFADFEYEIELYIGVRFDPVFRLKDLDNYYFFMVRPVGTLGALYGYITPCVMYQGVMTCEESIVNEQVPIEKDVWTTMKVAGIGNVIEFYYGGQFFGTWIEPNNYLSQGSIGFKSTGPQGSFFDNIKIRLLEP